MFELSLHILDLVQNAISAGASLIRIEITIEGDFLTIVIADDGCGMSPELLARVASPFATTRTTRKVGLGIPMFKQLAESCDGSFSLSSKVGVGTTLKAIFRRDHVDLPPLGDLSGTMRSLILGAGEKSDFLLIYRVEEDAFTFDTREIKTALGGMPLCEPEILTWIGQYLKEGIAEAQKQA